MHMSNVLGCTVAAIALAGAAVTPAAESPPASPAPPVAAQWKAQRLDFSYTGFTTRYTCDGLEDKVRQILLEFGARKDLKVRATGCESGPRGPDYPSRFAWVNAEFYS